jgi:hypothetical protein
MNTINSISPYKSGGGWVFDDKSRGLYGEAFVSGIPNIITNMLSMENIIADNFTVIFSQIKFPGAKYVLEKISGNIGSGTTYSIELGGNILSGWLCPALGKYFTKSPKKIYIQIVK